MASTISLEAIRQIGSERDADGAYHLEFATTDGLIEGRLHVGDAARLAVIWTGVEERRCIGLAQRLAGEGVASLRVKHRFTEDAEQCVIDLLVCVFAMREAGFTRLFVGGEGQGVDVANRAADASEHLSAVILPGASKENLFIWFASANV